MLGIDPGLSRCGYGAVRADATGTRATAIGVIRTAPSTPLP
ncbi:MAG: crossover junction endodeoxyribonuclease RuvC, partial [Acidimicrobiales bacterium]|nr:crossover junction endodeoxyribonuclease RuvC [Acidimicrobiales bacterium]